MPLRGRGPDRIVTDASTTTAEEKQGRTEHGRENPPGIALPDRRHRFGPPQSNQEKSVHDSPLWTGSNPVSTAGREIFPTWPEGVGRPRQNPE
ncbi:MAG: hypothetical protein OZSIB_2995 [Candidatus Ozemobacter sibiricus]|uniref:Uncharacterized protein n=1 Tax=Candidatus Ozemobacter sibiricus TaxID=2268124 RepID=A0A367ZTJ6_9BACT|nr:MAG: hypothetical protein OZSIB_2995 [Candidatus Ozemobacter sibiricus]